MKVKVLSLTIGLSMLQGCTGGGTKTAAELLETQNYIQLQQSGNKIYVKNHAVNESFVNKLPSGQMQYTGLAAFTDTAPAIVAAVTTGGTAAVKPDLFSGGTEIPNAIGRMQIDANFANKTATGEITNIQKVATKNASPVTFKTGYPLIGTIDIKNGIISANELSASFVGNLNDEGVDNIYQGTLKGLFVGVNGEGLYGDFDTGTIAGGAAGSLKGGFLTEVGQ
jgi:hypothetical protein